MRAAKPEHFGRRGQIRALREDDIGAAGQRFPNGFIRPSPHDDRVAHGQAFEPLQILADMPGDFAFVANDAVFGHGDDNGEGHTATLNLILRVRVIIDHLEILEPQLVERFLGDDQARQRARLALELFAKPGHVVVFGQLATVGATRCRYAHRRSYG